MANSMIGVGILAMPFCVQEVKIILPRTANDLNLKQCGLILGSVVLLLGAILTQWSCKMLIMASHLAKALTYGCVGMAIQPVSPWLTQFLMLYRSVAERVHGKWGMFLVHIRCVTSMDALFCLFASSLH